MKVTKKQMVMEYLQKHKKGITDKDALEKLEVSRLSTIIKALEKDGVKVNKETKKPRGKEEYVVYTLA